MHILALFNSIQANLDEEEEKIVPNGPKCQGKWTCAQAGQAEFSGICQAGMDCFNELGLEARAGRTAQGLALENFFLTKCWRDEGIHAPTLEQEIADAIVRVDVRLLWPL